MTLLRISSLLMSISSIVVVVALAIAFGLSDVLPIGLLVLGHALAMIAAVGIKVGYVVRLEALAQERRISQAA
ncbi:hypothetical protein [Allohahella marinimesophila]|uniref:Uncharacterized protein n=1 Tax=Allohahella marinimesophila TaxID=1054972 RepID=A0ABP7NH56_9GAMM